MDAATLNAAISGISHKSSGVGPGIQSKAAMEVSQETDAADPAAMEVSQETDAADPGAVKKPIRGQVTTATMEATAKKSSGIEQGAPLDETAMRDILS